MLFRELFKSDTKRDTPQNWGTSLQPHYARRRPPQSPRCPAARTKVAAPCRGLVAALGITQQRIKSPTHRPWLYGTTLRQPKEPTDGTGHGNRRKP